MVNRSEPARDGEINGNEFDAGTEIRKKITIGSWYVSCCRNQAGKSFIKYAVKARDQSKNAYLRIQ